MLLASHMAGIGMGTTGLGLVHAIGHAIGGRHDLPHGVTLAMVLPQVLRFSEPARRDRLASIAFALGVGDTGRDSGWNAAGGDRRGHEPAGPGRAGGAPGRLRDRRGGLRRDRR